MTPIQVVGVGLDGAAGLSPALQALIAAATLLVGSDRHLSYFPHYSGQRLLLQDLSQAMRQLHQQLHTHPESQIVVLVSGDPLFFGLGRLLLQEFPPEHLTFHPHLSAVQLAFNRIKIPWQDAQIISAHGRSLEELTQVLQQGGAKIAVLTDPTHTPAAIARLILALDLPTAYQFWVCENLGGPEERVQVFPPEAVVCQTFAPLNLVVLLRQTPTPTDPLPLQTLPRLGIPDGAFLSFSDRPGLITKREVRILALGELGLKPGQVIWDIGAGTGSVAIEIARLVPDATIYAIEKTAVGTHLIRQNQQRFQVPNLIPVHGSAPDSLQDLPQPDRVFIGGSGGQLLPILETCQIRTVASARLVIALATLEHLHLALDWLKSHAWETQLLQVQLARSLPIASLTRMAPLNPVILVKADR